MPIRAWIARYSPNALTMGAALAAGPVDSLSCMELKIQVIAVNTTAPISPSFTASKAPTKQAAKGSRPKLRAENSGTQI